MSQKVRTRKQRRYPPKVVPPVQNAAGSTNTTEVLFKPNVERGSISPSVKEIEPLQSTYAYVIGDLKQVVLITVVMFALLLIAYFIMR